MSDPLNGLAMWDTWQDAVRRALPAFAKSPHYVEQDSLKTEEVEAVVAALETDPPGMVRDVAHGARVFETRHGPVTRQWVDSMIEIDFLRRWLHAHFSAFDVLDIGAGYGRLAAMLAPLVRSYICVDAVPVSVEVCRAYTQLYAPTVQVLDIPTFRKALAEKLMKPNLAINIHSWNECSLVQIRAWLDILDELRVPFLFTVSHGQNPDAFPSGQTLSGVKTQTPYYAWEAGGPSFKPMLLERYDLVAEESIGLSGHPHALWSRRP